MSILKPPTKEVDVDFMVFVERHATDLLKWDILTFFGRNPHYSASVTSIAKEIGRSNLAVRSELGDLALLGILDQTRTKENQSLYQLTKTSHLRKLILKFADIQLVD